MTLVVASSGVEITELMLDLDLTDYACGGTTMSGGLGVGTKGPIPIEGDSFTASNSSVVWEGIFESESRASGTVQASLPSGVGGPPCEIGPFSWTAEPDEAAAGAESEQDMGSAEPAEDPSASDETTPATVTPDAFEDPFDDELGDGWRWRSETPDLWSLSDTSGWLTVTAVDPPQNVLVRDAPDGTFQAETAVRFAPTTNFQFAGLFVGSDESSYVQLGRAYCSSADVPDFCIDDGVYMDNIQNGETVGSSVSELPDEPNVIYLRLVVDGESVSGYVSSDGESWTLVGEQTRSGPALEIGLIAGRARVEPAVAEFDYFTSSAGTNASAATSTTTPAIAAAPELIRLAPGDVARNYRLDVLEGEYQLTTGATLRAGSTLLNVPEEYLQFYEGLRIDVAGPVPLGGEMYPAGSQLIVNAAGEFVER